MKRCNVRRGAPWIVALFLAAFTACGGDDNGGTGVGNGNGNGGETPTVTAEVDVNDNVFQPDFNQVAPGATVTWTWVGSNTHNVTFSDQSIAGSSTQTSGTFATAMPSTAGDYDYVCTIHSSQGMTGTVRVE